MIPFLAAFFDRFKYKSIGVRAVEFAEKELGRGEDPKLGNNRGGAVDGYRLAAGLKSGGNDAWCAAFGSAMLVKAWLKGDKLFSTSSGAKKMARNLQDAGWRVVEEPQRGDIIVWNRGDGKPENEWMGHFALIRDYQKRGDKLSTVEGNKGPKVAFFSYPDGKWRERKFILLRCPQ